MNKVEHIAAHVALHDNLDKLVADFLANTSNLPSRTSVTDLMAWSHKQTVQPDHPPEK